MDFEKSLKGLEICNESSNLLKYFVTYLIFFSSVRFSLIKPFVPRREIIDRVAQLAQRHVEEQQDAAYII